MLYNTGKNEERETHKYTHIERQTDTDRHTRVERETHTDVDRTQIYASLIKF